MHSSFHLENRITLRQSLPKGSIAVLFSGSAPRKTADEMYPFFANRNFVYLTGIQQAESVLLIPAEGEEALYLLPPDLLAERWNGRRLTPQQAADASGVAQIRPLGEWETALDRLLLSGNVSSLYLDLDKFTRQEPDGPAHQLAKYVGDRFPHIAIRNLLPQLKAQRTIKKPCEIQAMRKAQAITREGILAMMRASRPGMYEYQYKAEFDYQLLQHGVLSPAFPPIISAGENNFCIHYYAYTGQARDGDMILNDVGACWDGLGTDVSRGWPCNGKFTDRQRILYECAFRTSEHMFATLKPGLPMASVDQTIREVNFQHLKETGVLKSYDEIGKLMWHGGAHHVGYDTHDVVDATQPLAPGMVFCVDVGIYHEEWGIGFRLEDNCLITEDGCENLSAVTPRSIQDIEDVMGGNGQ